MTHLNNHSKNFKWKRKLRLLNSYSRVGDDKNMLTLKIPKNKETYESEAVSRQDLQTITAKGLT